jgi:NAD(P)-dependent dehydrogenase (short-subunit alcohol dehydrogenase family)
MNPSFLGRHIVVTGAANGIGAGCVRHFVERGAYVSAWDIDEDNGRKLSAELGEHVYFEKLDVSNEDAVINASASCVARRGGVHHLVNSAGVQGAYVSATQITLSEWHRVMNVNIVSQLLAAKHVIPLMQASGGGCVVNVSSVNALHCQAKTVAYATSKAAILGLTRSIAVDYAPAIRCVAICPGAVDTPLLRNALNSLPDPEKAMYNLKAMHLGQRIATPDEIASLIGFVCSDEGSFITGHELRMDGGLGVALGGNHGA